nr:M23 family metallopeptidase [Desulfobulbaceae bacterium]
MENNLYIVLSGERKQTKSYAISKKKIRALIFFSTSLMIVLFLFGALGIKFTTENILLKSTLATTQDELQSAKAWNEQFENRITKQVAEKERQLQSTLDNLLDKNEEKETLLNNALTELKSRSKVIESILKTVGIKVKEPKETSNSGGPFVPLSEDSLDDLTFTIDHYLETIKTLPLGPPVWGEITSEYGRRIDPINNQGAFHAGIDIRERLGAKIVTTADGIVIEKGYTKGEGNYLVIEHSEHFKTRYFHMQKSLVSRGDKVKRGQTVGLVGNTGRSTGPHLHYEIIYRGQSVNPINYVRIARKIPNA